MLVSPVVLNSRPLVTLLPNQIKPLYKEIKKLLKLRVLLPSKIYIRLERQLILTLRSRHKNNAVSCFLQRCKIRGMLLLIHGEVTEAHI